MTQTVMLIEVQYASIWGTPSVEIYYSTMRLQVVKQIRFSTESEKLAPSKKSLKIKLSLIECLGKNKSLGNTDIEKCMTFTQTVLHGGNINEACVETRITIYGNQKIKSSMTLPPDRDCVTQVIVPAHHQCYYWLHCLQEIISPISFLGYG